MTGPGARLATAGFAAALLVACASGPPRSDALFSHVSEGMTQGEVQQLIGPPDDSMAFPLSHTLAWDYLYQDTWGYTAEFSVTFDQGGRVVSKLSKRLTRRDMLLR
jgi:outer membrane protein assembly factor BamE (lipoprotein component of BamABCDE complex)